MKFKVVEEAIKECRQHLDSTKTGGSQTENRLAAYLLVLISAQFELRIEAIIEAYAKRQKDRRIESFILGAAGKQLRSPKISTITGFLSWFDGKWGETFTKHAGNQATAAYDSIISNRHAFVHEAQCNVTISDLEGFYHDGSPVFSALVATFELRAHEVRHLH